MQPAIETTFAQHIRNVMVLMQISTRQTEVAFEVQHGYDRSSHHFRIRHLALGMLVMMQGFEHVITQAKHNYNLGIHGFSFAVVVGIPRL